MPRIERGSLGPAPRRARRAGHWPRRVSPPPRRCSPVAGWRASTAWQRPPVPLLAPLVEAAGELQPPRSLFRAGAPVEPWPA
eukprot:5402251-Lingulodinium_polyedra.AAC.1